ncbi:hypothetical protein BKA65DRAFT_545866 [Rhexocercosporidium sp. MPI-PUGE-AT-0058]|nr:hypothetical protein BKA65DRAFT_545866 [Rhexocercosporidium sp. MPI-PUGE-AT-0058]
MAYPESPSSSSAISSLELPSPERPQIYVVDSSSPLIWGKGTTSPTLTEAPRPPSSNQQRSAHLTPWLEMKTQSPTSTSSNVLALIFGCLLLITLVVLPNSICKKQAPIGSGKGHHDHENYTTPLLWFAATCYVTGIAGFCWLWHNNRSSHLWLANHIFLPITLHSGLGLALTLMHVYTAEKGVWILTSIANAALTTCTAVNSLFLYIRHAALARKALEEH